MTRRPRKALIIGAGIAGPVAAIFLKRAGFDAELHEAWPYSTGIGGGLQIAPNGMHVLAELGLAKEMIRRGSVAESFDFFSQSGRRLGSLNRNMETRFGQPAVNMCRAALNEVLINRAWCSNSCISPTAPRPKAISSSAPTACIPRCARMWCPTAPSRSTPA